MTPIPTPAVEWTDIIKNCVTTDGVATLDCIPAIIQNVIAAAFLFGGIITFMLIMYSGVKRILSGGDPKQVEGARKTMTYAIIGFLIILLSFTILNLISSLTGVKCILNFGFGSCK